MRRDPDPKAVFEAAVSERMPVAPDGTRSMPDSGGRAPDGCSEPLAVDSGGNDAVCVFGSGWAAAESAGADGIVEGGWINVVIVADCPPITSAGSLRRKKYQ